MRKFWNSIKSYVYIIIVVLIIRTWFVTPAIVNGDSMVPTLIDGDVVIVNKIYMNIYDIKRLDMFVIKNEADNDKIIKRVIGLPNETIECKNNVIYINGKKLESDINFESTEDFTATTSDGEYFVLGDNRDVSKDSRLLGNFKKEDFVGKVSLRLFPFNKFGFVD